MSPDPWNLRARVPMAIRAIEDLSEEALSNVIWGRIKGEQGARLPKFERGEYPSDLFVDVVKNAPGDQHNLLRRMKSAVARILVRETNRQVLTDVDAIAETIFLAARIESEAAVNPIFVIVTHPDSREHRVDGERLQSRALRALLGLLIAFPARATQAHQSLFEELMFESEYTVTCLTALVGLFKQDQESLIRQLKEKDSPIDKTELDLHLTVSGLFER